MLNDRAREILAFIQRSTRDRGFPPTIREIGEHFKISSTNGVRYYLNILEKSGQLRRKGKISRGIETTGARAGGLGIPILGRVAAGQPTLAEENYEGRLEADRVFGQPDELFALRVKGDSMIDAGIIEGDYVIVRSQERATAGEIVVGMLENEATVKYYQPRRDRIELVAANPNYDPIVVGPESEFRILGVVKGVLRTMGR
jgi:repressor LexA